MRPLYATAVGLLPLGATGQEYRDSSMRVQRTSILGDCAHLSKECRTAQTEVKGTVADYHAKLVDRLPDDAVCKDGEYIACYRLPSRRQGFCLYFQGLPQGTIRAQGEVRALTSRLVALSKSENACHTRCGRAWDTNCGSAKQQGVLKLDYVTKLCVDICARQFSG